MSFFYQIGIFILRTAIRGLSLFREKEKLRILGLKDWEKKLIKSREESHDYIWVHCASLGEFEQGRPLIEFFHKNTKYKIALSFFSSSGYEPRRNYEYADIVCYLPVDTRRNAEKFLIILKPSMAFFVKYEFWGNYLNTLKRHQTPTFLVSGIFREQHFFFKNYGSYARKILACFDLFFLQNEKSKQLLGSINFDNSVVTGDTRVDRVIQTASAPRKFPLIADFIKDRKCLVIGSSWAEDEVFFTNIFESEEIAFLLAPHKISEPNIKNIKRQFPKAILYSNLVENNSLEGNLLVIDNIGMLQYLYQYADIAYVGGAMKTGLHNILEPMAFGVPVIFGKKYQKFQEAVAMVESGGAFSVESQAEFETIFYSLLKDKKHYNTAVRAIHDYLNANQGATQKIIATLERYEYLVSNV